MVLPGFKQLLCKAFTIGEKEKVDSRKKRVARAVNATDFFDAAGIVEEGQEMMYEEQHHDVEAMTLLANGDDAVRDDTFLQEVGYREIAAECEVRDDIEQTIISEHEQSQRNSLNRKEDQKSSATFVESEKAIRQAIVPQLSNYFKKSPNWGTKKRPKKMKIKVDMTVVIAEDDCISLGSSEGDHGGMVIDVSELREVTDGVINLDENVRTASKSKNDNLISQRRRLCPPTPDKVNGNLRAQSSVIVSRLSPKSTTRCSPHNDDNAVYDPLLLLDYSPSVPHTPTRGRFSYPPAPDMPRTHSETVATAESSVPGPASTELNSTGFAATNSAIVQPDCIFSETPKPEVPDTLEKVSNGEQHGSSASKDDANTSHVAHHINVSCPSEDIHDSKKNTETPPTALCVRRLNNNAKEKNSALSAADIALRKRCDSDDSSILQKICDSGDAASERPTSGVDRPFSREPSPPTSDTQLAATKLAPTSEDHEESFLTILTDVNEGQAINSEPLQHSLSQCSRSTRPKPFPEAPKSRRNKSMGSVTSSTCNDEHTSPSFIFVNNDLPPLLFANSSLCDSKTGLPSVIGSTNFEDDPSILSEDDMASEKSVATVTLQALMNRIEDAKMEMLSLPDTQANIPRRMQLAKLIETLAGAAVAVGQLEEAERSKLS